MSREFAAPVLVRGIRREDLIEFDGQPRYGRGEEGDRDDDADISADIFVARRDRAKCAIANTYDGIRLNASRRCVDPVIVVVDAA